jgi:sialic acid synthase SpsE
VRRFIGDCRNRRYYEGSAGRQEMVDAAQRAGVEVVKHQTHIVEDEMSWAAKKKVIPVSRMFRFMKLCRALDEPMNWS